MSVAIAEPITELSEEHLLRWRGDVAGFLEEACCIRHPSGEVGPIRLFPHQREFIRQADKRDPFGNLVHKVVVASWPKREGKSEIAAGIGAHRLFCMRETESYILANSEEQGGNNIMGAIDDIAKLSPALQQMRPEMQKSRTNIPLAIRVPQWDSSIRVLPCNITTVQGIGIGAWSLLLSDETHAAKDPGVYDYLSAQCEADNAQIIISSQAGPPTDDNPVYRLYQARREPEIFVDYRTEVATPWAKRLSALDRKTKPRPVWDRLWGNAWGARGQRLFDPKEVDACVGRYKLPQTREQFLKLRSEFDIVRVGAGLDRAMAWLRQGAGDNSVWHAVGETRDGRFIVLQSDLLPTGAEAEVHAAAGKSRQLFGVRQPILEEFQCADLSSRVPGAMMRRMTQPAKVRMYNGLYQLVASRQLVYSGECKQLRKELLDVMVDTTSAQPKFEGKPHDDYPDSLIWAIESCASGGIIISRFAAKPRGM